MHLRTSHVLFAATWIVACSGGCGSASDESPPIPALDGGSDVSLQDQDAALPDQKTSDQAASDQSTNDQTAADQSTSDQSSADQVSSDQVVQDQALGDAPADQVDDAQCKALFEQCSGSTQCCNTAQCEVVGNMAYKVCCLAVGNPCKEMSDCCGANTFCAGPVGSEVCSACAGGGFVCQKPEDCCYGFGCGDDGLCHGL
jgi:hypothetical protein